MAPYDAGKPLLEYDDMWRGFDPRAEPLESEVLKEWEEDDVVLRVIRFRIGVFKGQKAMMAGIYGYPKGKKELPGLLQVHGGGQYAHSNAVQTNAKRGYATLSIAWAGRISAPGYMVAPAEVRLFWEGKSNDPKYKLTTDWGKLDAYHAPSRYGRDAFPSIPVAEWTLDPVASPRNNSWFLIALAGRRALTFLERQPEVDGSRLGVYGHSMGGKLTVMITGADNRVRAAAPSCGGISDRYTDDELHFATVSDPPSLQRITAPIVFLSPANDFHGRVNDLGSAIEEIQSTQWRISCSPHLNHQDTPEFEVATQVWFDHHLRGNFVVPDNPKSELILEEGKLPKLRVVPDTGARISGVEVYFTQQGILQKRGGAKDDSSKTKHRFWQFVRPLKDERTGTWVAELPIFSADRSLWAYANVRYEMEEPIKGAGYYYGNYQTQSFILSSLLQLASSEDLQKKAALPKWDSNRLIESFESEWRKNWFTYNLNKWGIRTNKLIEPHWAAPDSESRLSFEVRSQLPNNLVVWLDGFGKECALLGNHLWQRFALSFSALKDGDGTPLNSWTGIRELRLSDQEKLGSKGGGGGLSKSLGNDWKGDPPEFRNLRWIR